MARKGKASPGQSEQKNNCAANGLLIKSFIFAFSKRHTQRKSCALLRAALNRGRMDAARKLMKNNTAEASARIP